MARHREIASLMKKLGRKLTTLHISGYYGVDERHQVPGKGVLDWQIYMKTLDEIGYDGPFNFEIYFRNGESIKERLKIIDSAYSFLMKLR